MKRKRKQDNCFNTHALHNAWIPMGKRKLFFSLISSFCLFVIFCESKHLPTDHIIIYSEFYSEPVSSIKMEFLYQNSRLGLMRNDISKKHKYPPWRCNILLLNDFRLSKFISTDHHAEQKFILALLWSEEGAKKHQSFAALFVTQKWT